MFMDCKHASSLYFRDRACLVSIRKYYDQGFLICPLQVGIWACQLDPNQAPIGSVTRILVQEAFCLLGFLGTFKDCCLVFERDDGDLWDVLRKFRRLGVNPDLNPKP